MKVDMAKAYDHVEWAFLESVMLRMGFDIKWVQSIMTFISSIRYHILRNGREFGSILPQGILYLLMYLLYVRKLLPHL